MIRVCRRTIKATFINSKRPNSNNMTSTMSKDDLFLPGITITIFALTLWSSSQSPSSPSHLIATVRMVNLEGCVPVFVSFVIINFVYNQVYTVQAHSIQVIDSSDAEVEVPHSTALARHNGPPPPPPGLADPAKAIESFALKRRRLNSGSSSTTAVASTSASTTSSATIASSSVTGPSHSTSEKTAPPRESPISKDTPKPTTSRTSRSHRKETLTKSAGKRKAADTDDDRTQPSDNDDDKEMAVDT